MPKKLEFPSKNVKEENNASNKVGLTLHEWQRMRRGLFLENRLFLNKSRSKWASIGVEGDQSGKFRKVLRIGGENESSFVSFNERETQFLFSVLAKDKNLNGSDTSFVDKWCIFTDEELEDSDRIIRLEPTAFNLDIYELQNTESKGWPSYITIGKTSLIELFRFAELIHSIIEHKKVSFFYETFYTFVNDYKQHVLFNEHVTFKQFMVAQAIEYCGKNSFKHSIACDMFTKCFEYVDYVLQKKNIVQQHK